MHTAAAPRPDHRRDHRPDRRPGHRSDHRAVDGAALELEVADGEATLRLATGPADVDVLAGAALLREAVGDARRRHAGRVHTVLDCSTATGGVLLEALHARLGSDVERIALRRAGSSVLVTLTLRPPAPARGQGTGRETGHDTGRDPRHATRDRTRPAARPVARPAARPVRLTAPAIPR